MKNAFDANVPRLRPLGHKQSASSSTTAEAAVEPPEASAAPAPVAPPEPATPPAPEVAVARLREHMQTRSRRGKATKAGAAATRPAATPAAQAAPEAPSARNAFAERIAAAVAGLETGAAPHRVAPVEIQDDTLARGRERVQRLRERLESALRTDPTDGPLEPRAAAEAARHLVDGFRARLQALAEERDALEDALAAARAEGDGLKAQLGESGRRREAAEAVARERVELARGLMQELEALADERDQALARVASFKALDEQQTRLLGEAEATLAAQQARLAAQLEREAELGRQLETRAAEVAELSGRLSRRTAERDELLERVQALEADVRGLQETRQALAEIKRMVDAARL